MGTHPDAVELFGGGFYEVAVGTEDAGFEVAGVFAFHAEAGAGEVGGAYVGGFEVEDDDFEMDSWAEDAFHAFDESGVFVEILTEGGTGFFGVDEADFYSAFGEVGKDFEQGLGSAAVFYVEVFDVGGADPQSFFDGFDSLCDLVVVRFVGDVGKF